MSFGEDLIPEVIVRERFGFSKATLASWRSRRKGPAFLVIGRRVFYPRAKLEAWLESRIVDPDALRPV